MNWMIGWMDELHEWLIDMKWNGTEMSWNESQRTWDDMKWKKMRWDERDKSINWLGLNWNEHLLNLSEANWIAWLTCDEMSWNGKTNKCI